MATRRAKHRPIASMTYSDWEGEQSEAAYLSDALPPPPTTRTDMELNVGVLRRHNPSIQEVHHVTPYVVVYEFSPATQAWEKAGIEGSAFIVSLQPSVTSGSRYAIFVLNRRSLDNFELELFSQEDIELTEEYIILQRGASDPLHQPQEPKVYGLWIFAEAPPASTAHQREETARLILECAGLVEAGRRAAALPPQLDDSYQPSPNIGGSDGAHHMAHDSVATAATGVEMARNGSLTAMLEQQRHADDAWSIRSHSPSNQFPPHLSQQQQLQTQGQIAPSQTSAPNFIPSTDTDFFLSAKPPGTGTRTTPSPAVSTREGSVSGIGHKENLLDLFKRAGDNYRGNTG